MSFQMNSPAQQGRASAAVMAAALRPASVQTPISLHMESQATKPGAATFSGSNSLAALPLLNASATLSGQNTFTAVIFALNSAQGLGGTFTLGGGSVTISSPPNYTSPVSQPTSMFAPQHPYKYYFVLYDTLSGAALTTLQSYSNMTLNLGLNGVDTLSLTLATSDPAATQSNMSTLNREIGVFRSDLTNPIAKPLFVGPITQVTPSFSQRTITLSCNSVWWYLQHRSNELTYDFSNGGAGAEMGSIAWQVINDSLGKVPGGNIRLNKSPNYPANTGYYVTPNPNPYYLYDSDMIGTYVEKLGEGYPAGFDFMIEYARDGAQGITRYFNIYAPFKGQAVDQIISSQNGATEFTYDEVAGDIIGRVTEIGAIPDGSQTPVILRANSTPLTNGQIPMVEQIISRSDVNDAGPTIGDFYGGQYGGPNHILTNRGTYATNTVYHTYDSVLYQKKQYWAKSTVQNVQPQANSTYWGLLPSPLGIQALGDIYLHSWPARTYTITYTPNAALPFGFCTIGDSVPIKFTCDNFVFNATKRCTTQTISLSASGESVQMGFNEPPGPK